MKVTKESTLKLIEEINSKEIDLEKTLKRAYEFKGEDSFSIFTKYTRPEYYSDFSQKKKYKFDFMSERFYKIMKRYYISNKGIFIILANGFDYYSDDDKGYIIETLNDKIEFKSDEIYYTASTYGIKITEVEGKLKVEFGCMFGAAGCGFATIVFRLIDEVNGREADYNSLNNYVNQVAIKMMYDEIVFKE